MEITAMQLYWIMKLDSISFLLELLAALTGCFLVTVTVLGAAIFIDSGSDSDEARMLNRMRRWLVGIFVPLLILAIAVPDTKQYCAMYAVPKVVNSEQVKELGRNSLKVANIGMKMLVELIDEMDNDGKEKK